MSMKTMKIRTYDELISLPTFEERYEYLRLKGKVGIDTFGFDRYMNQSFYKSKEWKDIRNYVISRDEGFDLGVDGYPITGHIYIHHMNPLTPDDIKLSTDYLLNPQYLITTSFYTHQAIHYEVGNTFVEDLKVVQRKPNDTCPWR